MEEVLKGVGSNGIVGLTVLLVYLDYKFGIFSKGNGTKGKSDNCIRHRSQMDEIFVWFSPKGPMHRLSSQMEDVKDATKENTMVLRDIKEVLEK